MKPDLDPCDIEGLTRRHAELVRATRTLYERNPYVRSTSDIRTLASRRIAAARRILILFVFAIFALLVLALAFSIAPGTRP